MPSPNNILVFITVLIISAQAFLPIIEKSSYTYDPDSIAQNEKIVRLFLRLASDTANHALRLKNEAKLRKVLTPRVDKNEPAVHVQLSDEKPGRTSAKRGNIELKEQLVHLYEKKRDANQSEEEQKAPCIPVQRDSGIPPRRENSEKILQKCEISKNISGKHDGMDESKDSLALKKDSIVKLITVSNSEDKLAESSAKTQKPVIIEDSTNLPIEIENRMMFSDQKHDDNNSSDVYSNTTSNTGTKIASNDSSHHKDTGRVSQTAHMTVNQSAESSKFQRIKIGDNLNPLELNHNSTESPEQAQKEGSGASPKGRLSSQDSAPLAEKLVNGTSNSPSGLNGTLDRPRELQSSGGQNKTAAKEIHHQASDTASNGQSQSEKPINSTQGLASNGQSGNKTAEIAHGSSDSTSNFQSKSKDTTQKLVQNRHSANETSGIAHQSVGAALNIQPESSGMLNEAQGRIPKGQSWNQAGGVPNQAVGTTSNVQSGSKGKTNVVHGLASNGQSKITTPAMTNQDSGSSPNLESGPKRIINAAQGVTTYSQSGNHDAGSALQASETVSNLQSGLSRIINASAQNLTSNGPSQNQLTKIVHQAVNSGSHLEPSSREELSSVQNSGSNVLNKIISNISGNDGNQIIKSQSGNKDHENSENDALSGVLKSKKSGESLSNTGIKVVTNQGSSLLANAYHAVPAISNLGIETSGPLMDTGDAVVRSIQRENPARELLGVNAGQLYQTGSKLTGVLPLFRFLPDFNVQSTLSDDKGPKKDEEATDDGIPETKLNDFARKFGDALRSVKSR